MRKPMCRIQEGQPARWKAQLYKMEECLPRLIRKLPESHLGSVNVSIWTAKNDTTTKINTNSSSSSLTLIGCVIAGANLYFMVESWTWFSCSSSSSSTTTARHHHTRVHTQKSQRIKNSGWWRAHHFISTVVGGVHIGVARRRMLPFRPS